MAICLSCLGAKSLPTIGHMGTKKCDSCNGTGKGEITLTDYLLREATKDSKTEGLVLELEAEEEYKPVSMAEPIVEPEPKEKKKKADKKKSKWGI